jgi:flagellar protein FlaG
MKLDSINNVNPTAPVTERPQLRLPAQAAADATAVVAAIQAIDQSQIKKALDEGNQKMQSLGGSLEFSIDRQTGKTVVRIIDTSTNQLIRQIPSEEMLTIARSLDKLQGLLIKQRA